MLPWDKAKPYSLHCSGIVRQITTSDWRWTPKRQNSSSPSPSKDPLMLAHFKMHEQGRYTYSHLLKSDNRKYVCEFPSKAGKKKRGFHDCYFGKYFSQGHRLVNKMITRNYSMYHEYFLVCTEQFKAL